MLLKKFIDVFRQCKCYASTFVKDIKESYAIEDSVIVRSSRTLFSQLDSFSWAS